MAPHLVETTALSRCSYGIVSITVRPIYLDHNATTPLDPRVLSEMLPFFTQHFGNASSAGHAWGWTAREAVELSRTRLAETLHADPREIYFTSGATEALNLAVQGLVRTWSGKPIHLIVPLDAHRALIDPHQWAESHGIEVSWLPVSSEGTCLLSHLEAALRPHTRLVSVTHVNNETGVIHPVADWHARCRAAGIPLLVDATQAPGKIPLTFAHADLMALSAHKAGGPKGVGALLVRRRQPRVRLQPLLLGGGQEDGLRAGTLNTPGLVGMAHAFALAEAERETHVARWMRWQAHLEEALAQTFGDRVLINGKGASRVANTINLTVPRVQPSALMSALRPLAVSGGSACASGSGKPSHVLIAYGLPAQDALRSVRLSAGTTTTDDELALATSHVMEVLERLLG